MVHHHRHLHQKKNKQPFDYVVYFFMIATPLFELPQAFNIYVNHSAEGVSIWTWGFFFVVSLVWAAYAIHNKLRPLIVTYAMYMLFEAVIVIGIVKYS